MQSERDRDAVECAITGSDRAYVVRYFQVTDVIHHFANLLARAWTQSVVWMSTSTLSVVMEIAIFLTALGIAFWKKRFDWKAVLKNTFTTLVILTIFGWVILYASALVTTLYRDHIFLVSSNQQREDEIDQLQSENDELRNSTKALSVKLQDSHKTEDQIEKVKNKPKQADRCWFVNYFGLANSTVKGAVTATTVIIHCNHKVEAPYEVRAGFDRPILPGNATVPDGGVQSGAMGVEGLVFKATLNPSLLTDQILTITVYGTTDQYPRAGGVTVKSLE